MNCRRLYSELRTRNWRHNTKLRPGNVLSSMYSALQLMMWIFELFCIYTFYLIWYVHDVFSQFTMTSLSCSHYTTWFWLLQICARLPRSSGFCRGGSCLSLCEYNGKYSCICDEGKCVWQWRWAMQCHTTICIRKWSVWLIRQTWGPSEYSVKWIIVWN